MACYDKVMEIYLSLFGDGDAEIARCYNNIGKVYEAKGDKDKASEFRQKAQDIMDNM